LEPLAIDQRSSIIAYQYDGQAGNNAIPAQRLGAVADSVPPGSGNRGASKNYSHENLLKFLEKKTKTLTAEYAE
jgi:hypothetical protein